MNLSLSDDRMYKIRASRKHFPDDPDDETKIILKNTTWVKCEPKS